MNTASVRRAVCLFAILFSALASVVYADMAEIKKYKQAFPGETVKCSNCHAVAIPKKTGDHSLNAYGQKVTQAKPTTVESYKAAGKA